ncbi:MAG: 50S ribosomal protein L32e [Thaumarchaeota archaeon]|nr:50S ribosomal protein L32e [Nitrososphaerota archaeon]
MKRVKLPKKQAAQKKVDIARLFALRRELKQRKPDFVRPESWRYVRLHEPWRKPKGIDHKVRLSVKGWPPLVKVGYRGPKAVRGLHPSGMRDILVHNTNEMEKLNPRTDAARFAATLGGKARAMLMQKAQQMGIKVLNPGTVKVVS